MDSGVSWLKVSSSYIRPTWQLLALGVGEQVFSQRRERWGRRSFQGLRVYIDLRDSGHRSMTVSQGVFALCPGLFPSLSFSQRCQNFVFLDLAILLLSVFDSRFCSLFQLSGFPDLQFDVPKLPLLLSLFLTLRSSSSLCFKVVFCSWPEWMAEYLWLGPLIHTMTLKLATPLLFS